jgi:hypothetical protein
VVVDGGTVQHTGRERPLVLVSGFGWSGSSVVSDLLCEYTRIVRPRGVEVKLVKVLSRMVERPQTADADGLAYVRAKIRPGGRYDTRAHRRRLRHCFTGLTREGFSERADRVVSRLEGAGLGAGRDARLDDALVREVLTDYLLLVNEALQPADQHAIYDNLVPAYQLSLLARLALDRLPTLHVYVVDRDPRDQYVELFEHDRPGAGDVDRFIHNFRRRRERYEQAREDFGTRNWDQVVTHLQFEDLVATDAPVVPQLRREAEDLVARTVGSGTWELGRRFQPEVSRTNVGKWRQVDDPGPYRRIAEELADWCGHHDPGARRVHRARRWWGARHR